ncbi:MAG: CDP-glycerol glycerophosphotransferase family protein [Eubacterium sp.]|nr:CDP-glycerol glycerophosphotransferase family protein [Eubacterium sp.]MDE6768003.1 CDP-glycerol glycerophosphotransferase family protein [Eubacterium sp.]
MKVLLFSILKLGLKVLYAPLKLFKTKNRIVYLSRQSNDKSLDILLLEKAVRDELPDIEQVFRLRMIPDGMGAKIKYCVDVIGDMYYLATSRVAILDTYSITVSCLKHKNDLKVIQMWHALGAVKKFGLQSVGTKEGRDEKVSNAMCMHKNYDYVLAPSKATARFYMEAFGCGADKMKICSLPRVDELLKNDGVSVRFYRENPDLTHKKIVLYLPTFRDREAYVAQELKVEFSQGMEDYHLIISTHPLFSKVKRDDRFFYNGSYSTIDLMKIADIIITDYSACAFEAAVLMKPLYFFVPDYNQYVEERGANIDLKSEMAQFTFENASELCTAIKSGIYDQNKLYAFKTKYVENAGNNNSQILAKFISMLISQK